MSTLSIHLGTSPDSSVKSVETLATALPTSTDQRLSSVEVFLGADAPYTPMDLASLTKYLKDGAVVTVYLLSNSTVEIKDVHTSFLLAGLRSHSERREVNGSRVLTAKKVELAASGLAAAPIQIRTNDAVMMDVEDDDIIDEDGLLTDPALAPPPKMSAATASKDDCGGRAPCDDCTCGRAEENASGNATNQKGEIKTSSCGKCHLGDAFRCGSCPYLGKPAFKPGEEHLVLDLQDDL